MNDKQLIELVKSYPVLYDASDDKYVDTDFKIGIWKIIGEKMNISWPLCKTRWCNIRDNFRKSLKKSKLMSELHARKVRPYKYSKQLHFVKKFIVDKELSNIDGDGEVTDDDEEFDESVIPELSSAAKAENITHIDDEMHLNMESQCGASTLSNETYQDDNIHRNKVKQTQSKTAAVTLMEYLIKKEEHEGSSASSHQHPVDAFLAGIAPALKRLPPRYWHYAKADMFATVQKYEFKLLTDEQQFVEPYPVSWSTPTSTPAGSSPSQGSYRLDFAADDDASSGEVINRESDQNQQETSLLPSPYCKLESE